MIGDENKYDGEKTRLDLVEPSLIEAVGRVRTYGVSKYKAERSWRNVEPSRYIAAAMRHFEAYRKGEKDDPESGMPHLWHCACNIMFLIEMEDEKKMNELDLNTFGEIIDKFLKDNDVNMLLTLPAGTLDVQVQDNLGLGCVIQFYILLNSIKPICNAMMQQMGIDKTSPEWTKTVDTFLGMIKNEMVG